jgi:hypothetical protein
MAPTAGEGPTVAASHIGTPGEADGPTAPAAARNSATDRPLSLFDAGPTEDGVRAGHAPAGVTEVEHTAVRDPAGRELAPGSVALRAGPVRSPESGSTSTVAASGLTAAGTAASGSTALPAEEVSALAAFPDAEGGTAGPVLDTDDLAASISRPLAAGNGDYSVQVSLHPPEFGQVRALLSLQGDVLHVTLTPEHSSGFEALSDALPALHEQLAGGGVEVHVSLGQPGDAPAGDGRGGADAGPVATTPSDNADQALALSATPITSTDPGRIHLIL